jgi:hypothetical protein
MYTVHTCNGLIVYVFLAKFVDDFEEDCGISIERELEKMERVLQDGDCDDLKGKLSMLF